MVFIIPIENKMLSVAVTTMLFKISVADRHNHSWPLFVENELSWKTFNKTKSSQWCRYYKKKSNNRSNCRRYYTSNTADSIFIHQGRRNPESLRNSALTYTITTKSKTNIIHIHFLKIVYFESRNVKTYFFNYSLKTVCLPLQILLFAEAIKNLITHRVSGRRKNLVPQ